MDAPDTTTLGITSCVTNYCCDTNAGNFTCQLIGSNLNRISKETGTHACQTADYYSSAGILQCAKTYCKYTNAIPKTACVALSQDTTLQRFGSDATTATHQVCVDKLVYKAGGIIECAYNYCIATNTSTSDQACEILSSATNRYGRNKATHTCLTFSTFVTSIDICVTNYCVAITGAT